MQIDFAYKPNEGLPFSAHRRLRAAGPVVWSEALGGWLVSSYEGVRTVLSDLTRFTSSGTAIAEAFGPEAMLINDTPLHNTVRAVWSKVVARAAMAAHTEELERNAARVLDAARPRLAAGEAVDLLPLFRQFILAFIGSSFAIPPDKFETFKRFGELSADTPALGLAKGSPEEQRHLIAKNGVLDLIREQIAERKVRFEKGEQPNDLIALMVAAEGKSGITMAMVVDNILNFMLGAADTTEKWFGNILIKLYTTPDLLAEVRADRGLIEPLMDEVMRIDTVAQMIQRRVKPGGAELCGVQMKAGDLVLLMLGVANQDPHEYKNPETFDLHRIGSVNVGFGFGFHHCLGINIARREAVAITTVFLDKFLKLRSIDPDYGDSWALWGPRALHITI